MVTLLSAPVNNELPFCKTTVKMTLFYIVLAVERYANRNFPVKVGFANYFSRLFLDLRKLDLSPKLLETFLVFLRYISSQIVDLQIYQV